MRFRELLRRSQTRINLLFTMSEIPQARPLGQRMRSDVFADDLFEVISSILNSIWWSQTGSNRRPHACKARALPAELWPRTRRRMLYAGYERRMRSIKVVGLGRLELPTSRLSSARSNQLSYKPLTLFLKGSGPACAQPAKLPAASHKRSPGACSSAKKEKRRRRNPANGAQRSGDRWPLMFQKRFDSCLLQVASF